jgi:type II secretory pathway pseudopilin PulG
MIKKQSFTLVELLVAVTIMAGAIAAIIYSYTAFSEISTTTKNISLASRAAYAKIEDIKSDSFYDIDNYKNQVFYPQTDDIYPQDIRYSNLNYRGIVYVSDISSTLKQITVVICWQQNGRTIGEDWVFESNPDPTAHPQPASPVTVTTLIAER